MLTCHYNMILYSFFGPLTFEFIVRQMKTKILSINHEARFRDKLGTLRHMCRLIGSCRMQFSITPSDRENDELTAVNAASSGWLMYRYRNFAHNNLMVLLILLKLSQ